MIDQKRKQRHLHFKAICGLKASICWKYLIFLVTVLFIREEWLRLLTSLKTGLLRQTSSEKLSQISRNKFQHYVFGGETGNKMEEFYSSIQHFDLTRLCSNLIFKFLARFKARFFFYQEFTKNQ